MLFHLYSFRYVFMESIPSSSENAKPYLPLVKSLKSLFVKLKVR